MVKDLRELETIKELLNSSPKGMTIIDVSRHMNISRNLAAKYLDMLLIAGEVSYKTFGRSKIFSLSEKLHFATALSLSSDLIAFVDSNLTVLDANEQFLKFSRIGREQVVGRSIEEINSGILMHRDILLNIKDALRGTEYAREISVVIDKQEYFLKAKLIPVVTGGSANRVAIVCENVTDRKKAEIALKQSEARYKAILEDQTEMICRAMPDTTITFVNDAWCRYFNRSREEHLGKKLIDVIPEYYQADYMRYFESIKAGKPAVVVDSSIPVRDGRSVWLQSTCRGIFDSSGNLAEMQIVSRDITGLKKAELALKDSESKFRIIFDNSPVGFCITSLDYRFLKVNPEICRILGYTERELLATNCKIIMYENSYPSEKSLAEDLQAGKLEQYVVKILYPRKDGSKVWLRKRMRLIRDEAGKPQYYLLMIEDITEQVRSMESLRVTRQVVDGNNIMVLRLNFDGDLTYVSDSLFKTLGYPLDELLKLKVWDVVQSFTPGMWSRHCLDIKKCGLINTESALLTKDRKALPVRVAASYLRLQDREYISVYTYEL